MNVALNLTSGAGDPITYEVKELFGQQRVLGTIQLDPETDKFEGMTRDGRSTGAHVRLEAAIDSLKSLVG